MLGVEAEFLAHEVSEQDFGNFYFESKNSQYRGLALTMPLKEICIGFIDRVDPIAKQISSVNTVIFESTGSIGISTDLLAFKNLLPAPGALKGTNTEVTVVTRSMVRHDQLHAAAADLDINFLDWHNFEEIQDRDLIISTTPAGATDGLSHLAHRFK